MPSICLRETLSENEILSLSKEFPHYDFKLNCEGSEWSTVEVFFGKNLSAEELALSSRLRWVHCLESDMEEIPLIEIKGRGNIVITLGKGQNVSHMVEFIIGSILAFAKHFFHWHDSARSSNDFWNLPLKNTMWGMENKILLQIGLGEVGSGVVKMANTLGMKTWGIRKYHSFHPYCHKTFPLENLHALLPAADVVALTLPKSAVRDTLFKEREFELMKKDSIFIQVGSAAWIDEGALIEAARTNKFRGIVLDAFQNSPLPRNSPLWNMSNIFFTPQASNYPEIDENLTFRFFRQNLRLFASGKINEMKNRLLL